ncbi:reverse transcriptase domain-containing protein [Burkholderia stagnalis]|uniref:reverse transcriptase domain-containing protein n=1 Tax=Burkholderia stagnalis TaxID=1503054 RepID=UPI001C89FE7E|nr:reverse transcriptase domain-containing protein [Burkholderia stagnalis]
MRILTALRAGTYRFEPMSCVTKASGETVVVWSAADALVIKCLTLLLHDHLPVHRACEHVRGHGGGAASVKRVHRLVRTGQYPFICRTDIRQYYANLDKSILLEQLRQHLHDPGLLDLLYQVIHYTVVDGGLFHTPSQGIARGSALSPLLAAFHLFALDHAFAAQAHLVYVRYMDDFLIFAKTRWQLRKAVKQLNKLMDSYGFEQHPDKTFIGKVDKGFDWMGFLFTAGGCTAVAPRALANHLAKLRRLYEQARRLSDNERRKRVAEYRARWVVWAGKFGRYDCGCTPGYEYTQGFAYCWQGWAISITDL